MGMDDILEESERRADDGGWIRYGVWNMEGYGCEERWECSGGRDRGRYD